MADENTIEVGLRHSDKVVRIPKDLIDPGARVQARAQNYVIENGLASFEEVHGEPGSTPGASGPLEAFAVGAGREIARAGSNVAQAVGDLFGNEDLSTREKAKQAEIARLAAPLKEEFPKSSFAGEVLPSFAIPGGRVAQVGVGALQGALEGDTAGERTFGAGAGSALAFGGQKLGDQAGLRFQNRIQQARGVAAAPARRALIDAGVPLSISERTSGPVSKPLARFFERGRFVLTGKQPNGAGQQRALTGLVNETLGLPPQSVLNRATLGQAVDANAQVFRTAADRAGGKFFPDEQLLESAGKVVNRFDEIGTDSIQMQRLIDRFSDFATSDELSGAAADSVLQLRKDLSKATVRAEQLTGPLVDAIAAIDDTIARNVPDLADELVTARDRFRMLLALRKGAALAPDGSINIRTFNNNLERVFRNFDAGTPLPRSLGPAGEAIAGFNEVTLPFGTSQSAENAAALAFPQAAALADPSALIKGAAALATPFTGGGTGGLIGGGVGRSLLPERDSPSRILIQEALNKMGLPSEI